MVSPQHRSLQYPAPHSRLRQGVSHINISESKLAHSIDSLVHASNFGPVRCFLLRKYFFQKSKSWNYSKKKIEVLSTARTFIHKLCQTLFRRCLRAMSFGKGKYALNYLLVTRLSHSKQYSFQPKCLLSEQVCLLFLQWSKLDISTGSNIMQE